ncbi:MAG: tetratricopeptide repeat protein, partial [Tumebacillaceae bacterium]
MNDICKKIGERVKHYRINRGMSQDQLADGICSRQTISLLENGQHFPSADFMKQIAVKLGVPFHEIMINEVKELDAKVQIDISKVYVEIEDYANAFLLIEELEVREDLLEYQRRELVLLKAECLLRSGSAGLAVDLLSDLLERLEDDHEPDDHFLAVLTDKLGTAYYFVSQLENAYAFYMRAYQISKRFPEHDPVSAKIAFNLGKILRMIDRPNEAIDHLIRAEEYFNQVSDLKKQAITLFELGIAYQIRGNLEQADAIILKALALYESLNLVKMARRVRESHAYTVLSERKPTRAIEVLIECALEYEQDGDRLNLVYTYARIAFLLLRKG